MSTGKQRYHFVASLKRDGDGMDFAAFAEGRGMTDAEADDFAREVLAVVAARRARGLVRNRSQRKRLARIARTWRLRGDDFDVVESYARSRLLPRLEERVKADNVITAEERQAIDALREVLEEPDPNRKAGDECELEVISTAELWGIWLGPLAYLVVQGVLLGIASVIGTRLAGLVAGWVGLFVGIGLCWHAVRRIKLMEQLKYCWVCRRVVRDWNRETVEDSDGNETEVRTCPRCGTRSPRTGCFANVVMVGYVPAIVITVIVLFIQYFGE